MGKGLGVGASAAGSRSCPVLTEDRQEEVERSLPSRPSEAFGISIDPKDKGKPWKYFKQKPDEWCIHIRKTSLPSACLRAGNVWPSSAGDALGSVRFQTGDHTVMTDSGRTPSSCLCLFKSKFGKRESSSQRVWPGVMQTDLKGI